MNIENLKYYAQQFRNALETVVSRKQYGRLTLFRSFPNGCCTYTSDLLATYIVDQGISARHIQTVASETYDERYTHCWIMFDEKLFIDITADQFNGKSYFKKYEPIPVCSIVPRNTYLYERFDEQKTRYERYTGIDSYNGGVLAELQIIYNAAIQQIGAKN